MTTTHTSTTPDEFFARLAEVRAQQIWARMSERRARRKWARMSETDRDYWARGVMESTIAGWPRLTAEQRSTCRELVAHMQSFQLRFGIPRGYAPWPTPLLQTAEADLVEWRERCNDLPQSPQHDSELFVPRDKMQAAADAMQLNQLASIRHETAMSTIRNIR